MKFLETDEHKDHSKFLQVSILYAREGADRVQSLVEDFKSAGKIGPGLTSKSFCVYEASCPLLDKYSITERDLRKLRMLGATAEIV